MAYSGREANIESHGLWEDGYYVGERPEWQKDIVERNVNMVARDKNHPCIIYWSMGNESGWGKNFDAAYEAIKALDPQKRLCIMSPKILLMQACSRITISSLICTPSSTT